MNPVHESTVRAVLTVALLGCVSSRPGAVAGRILSTVDSVPLPGALVQLQAAPNVRYAAVADSLGRFLVSPVVPRTYGVTVRSIGHAVYQGTLTIRPGVTSTATVLLSARCTLDSGSAMRDLQAGRPRLVFNEGIAPTALTIEDSAFQRRYRVRYEILGDSDPNAAECLAQNNRVVGRYLDGRYGHSWRAEARRD